MKLKIHDTISGHVTAYHVEDVIHNPKFGTVVVAYRDKDRVRRTAVFPAWYFEEGFTGRIAYNGIVASLTKRSNRS